MGSPSDWGGIGIKKKEEKCIRLPGRLKRPGGENPSSSRLIYTCLIKTKLKYFSHSAVLWVRRRRLGPPRSLRTKSFPRGISFRIFFFYYFLLLVRRLPRNVRRICFRVEYSYVDAESRRPLHCGRKTTYTKTTNTFFLHNNSSTRSLRVMSCATIIWQSFIRALTDSNEDVLYEKTRRIITILIRNARNRTEIFSLES